MPTNSKQAASIVDSILQSANKLITSVYWPASRRKMPIKNLARAEVGIMLRICSKTETAMDKLPERRQDKAKRIFTPSKSGNKATELQGVKGKITLNEGKYFFNLLPKPC